MCQLLVSRIRYFSVKLYLKWDWRGYPLRRTRMDEAKKGDWYHGWNKCWKIAQEKKKLKVLNVYYPWTLFRDDDDRLHSFITGWFLVSQDLCKSSVTIHYFPFWWVLQSCSTFMPWACNPINHGFISPPHSFKAIAKPKKRTFQRPILLLE